MKEATREVADLADRTDGIVVITKGRAETPPGGGADAPGLLHLYDSFAGFEFASASGLEGGSLAGMLRAMWPLLSDGAVEIRWIAEDQRVTTRMLLRISGANGLECRRQMRKILRSIPVFAEAFLPGWTLRALSLAELNSTLQPFVVADGGDLVRREIEVSVRDDTAVDIPLLLGVNPESVQLLVRALAQSDSPVVVSLAASPTEIDWRERGLLQKELTLLERALIEASEESRALNADGSPPSTVSRAASMLHMRLVALDLMGFLRLSIASAGEIDPVVRSVAEGALGAIPGSLCFTPAADTGDREAFLTNLTSIAFRPWGLQAEQEEGRESTNDCFLASLDEIAMTLCIPLPDGFLPMATAIRQPAPRPVPSVVPRKGLKIGVSRFTSTPRPVALSLGDRDRHMYVVGQTGAGKSTLLQRMAMADISAGRGVCVIDPHGDLVDGLLERYPKRRRDDLILFDPGDVDRPIGLNLLDAQTPQEQDFVIQETISMMYRIYDPAHSGIMGPRWEHWFRNAALTAMAAPDGGSLLDIPRLFTDDRYLADRLRYVRDPVIRDFWINEMGQTSDYHKSEMLGWFVGKFGAFRSNRTMRNIIGQRHSAFSMREVMDGGKVLLVKLPKGQIGEINAMWLGMILVTKVQMAALSRGNLPRSQRRPFALYVDEFQNFALTSFDSMISEARKYGLSLTLANQHVGQIPEGIRAAVFGNVGTLAVFRLGMPDAALMQRELNDFSIADFTRIENHRCLVRMAVEGRIQPAFDIYTYPPPRASREAEPEAALLRRSRLRYGKTADAAEAEALEARGAS